MQDLDLNLDLSNSMDGFAQQGLGLRMETAWISGPGMVRKVEVKKQDFVVENYSRRKGTGVGRAIPSAEFVCGGHRWKIFLCPQGANITAHNQGFASVLVNRISPSTNPTPIMVHFQLLDQSGNQSHWGLTGFYREVIQVDPSTQPLSAGCIKFIRRTELDSPHSHFLKNDSLKLRVRVGVFTYHIPDSFSSSFSSFSSSFSSFSSSSGLEPSEEMPSSSSSSNGLEPSEEMQWGDEFVFIKAQRRTLCAAKSALAHRCPKLLSYDHQGLLEDIVITDADLGVLKAAVVFICTGAIYMIDKTAIDNSDPLNLESFAAKLLAATTMLGLEPLKRMCEISLSNKISRESVVHLLHLAHVCNATQLKSACLQFNRSVIIKSDEFCSSFQDKNSFSTLKQKLTNTIQKRLNVSSTQLLYQSSPFQAAIPFVSGPDLDQCITK